MKVPRFIEVDLKTGESKVTYAEVDEKAYNEAVIKPFARFIYKRIKEDIATGKFKLDEIPEALPEDIKA